MGGWYDSYTRATFQNFVGLGAGGRRPVRALVGPWTHGGKTMELSYAGDVEFGHDAALPSFDELHLRWYDRWLRGVDNGLDAEAPLRIFVMGGGSGRRSGAGRLVHGGRWRDEDEWPLARAQETTFFLHGDGSLRPEPPAAGAAPRHFTYDPENPVPTIGGLYCAVGEFPCQRSHHAHSAEYKWTRVSRTDGKLLPMSRVNCSAVNPRAATRMRSRAQ